MSTYSQWAKKKLARRVTWVCGPEAVLVRDVLAAHRAGAPPDQLAVFWADGEDEAAIWDQLTACPPDGGRRAVVYGAQRLQHPGHAVVLAREPALETAMAVFVDDRPDFADTPAMTALKACKDAQLIRCCAPSSGDDKAALVASWWPGLPVTLAFGLLKRCGGSLDGAWQACEKARLAGLEPTQQRVALACGTVAAPDLADLLMAGNRAAAATAATAVPHGELGALFGLLAARLAAVEQIAAGTAAGLSAREAAARAGGSRYAASRAVPHAAGYSADRIRWCRRLLAATDAAWRSGASGGLAESLCALW